MFLSRICPQKNLLQAIRIVSKLNGNIQFDIFGPKEDQDYWRRCEKELNSLCSSVKWNYRGAVPSENVVNIFLQYDVLLLPTMGENFGHVIYEALMAGCIPLISDRTPWNSLEENICGYATALENIEQYIKCVQIYVDMDELQLSQQICNAMKYAERKYKENIQLSGYYKIIC